MGALGAILLAGYRNSGATRNPVFGQRLILLSTIALFALLLSPLLFDLRAGATVLQTGVAYALSALAILGVLFACIRLFRTGVLDAVMRSTAQISAMVFVILIGASLFALVFRELGGDHTVRAALEAAPGGATGALIVVMVVMFLLGFFLDFIEITFVVVPIVAPVLFMMGVDPVWLGVMMALNLQTSFLTPPFGFALFYLRGVAPPEVTSAAIYRGAAPFVIIQLLMIATVAALPWLATALPGLLYD